ncbi:MAG TPA: hypothetical protein VF363_11315 [Candidatus Eisenbacteria bacterium]
MERTKRGASALMALLVLIGIGCGKDKAVGPKPSEITGNWTATKVEYVSRTTPQTRVDLIALGGTVNVAIREDHAWIYVHTKSGGAPDTTTGTWSLDGDLFKVQPSGFPFQWVWDVSLSGNTLALSDADMEYDFDDNGTPEMADQFMTLVR